MSTCVTDYLHLLVEGEKSTLSFNTDIFALFYLYKYFTWVYVCAECLYLWKSENGFRSTKTRVLDGCETPCGADYQNQVFYKNNRNPELMRFLCNFWDHVFLCQGFSMKQKMSWEHTFIALSFWLSGLCHLPQSTIAMTSLSCWNLFWNSEPN